MGRQRRAPHARDTRGGGSAHKAVVFVLWLLLLLAPVQGRHPKNQSVGIGAGRKQVSLTVLVASKPSRGGVRLPSQSGFIETRIGTPGGENTPNQRRVNHITMTKVSPQEHLIGRVIACLLLSFIAMVAGVLYMLNYPDEQVQNYSIRLVSVVLSIFAAVLLEKIQLNFIKRELVMVALHKHVASKGSNAAIWIEFGLALTLTMMWFSAISLLSFRYRRSKPDMLAVKAFVAHEAAFVGIHCFGYFEKVVIAYWLALSPDWLDNLVYISFPIACIIGFMAAQKCTQHLRMMMKRRFGNPVAESDEHTGVHQPGSHPEHSASGSSEHSLEHGGHADLVDHISREAENDAIALICSFLVRQAVLFAVTGRVPSIKGDTARSPLQEFGAIVAVILCFMIALVVIQKMNNRSMSRDSQGEGDLGLLSERLHFWQFLSCMTISWCLLSLCQWCLQRWVGHLACWAVGSAVMVTPMAMMLLIGVDYLGDRSLIDPDLESCCVNGCGLLIGFAWEVAFAAAVDTLSMDVKFHVTTNILLCVSLILMIFPAWKFYVLPRASLSAPRRSPPEVDKPT